jgi:hypothetical protein
MVFNKKSKKLFIILKLGRQDLEIKYIKFSLYYYIYRYKHILKLKIQQKNKVLKKKIVILFFYWV